MRKALITGLLLCAACSPPVRTGVPADQNLQPYATMTPIPSADPATGLVRSSEVALPTPTPFAYTIRSGDTMGGIAEKFNVELDALLAANPGINPNSMTVGKGLQIPSTQRNLSGESTPTPAPLTMQQINCHAVMDGGVWCFALAHNDTPDVMENVTAQVTLTDSKGKPLSSQTALLPLDILPPGTSLPLTVFFAPGLPSGLHPQVQVLTAIRLLATDPRYLGASIQNTQVQVDWSGLSAQVSGRVVLPDNSKDAGRIWVAAVVYGSMGTVTGVRRYEADRGMQAGSSMPFSFQVSSLAGEITGVEFAVEARP